MKFLTLNTIFLGIIGLFLLGACNDQAINSDNSTANETKTTNTEVHSDDDDHDHSDDEKEGEHSHGGQVIESGQYHLEFVAEPNDDGTHIDFYLEKGEKHEHIGDAQVKAQIQLPNGEQKSIPLIYEADEKHYHGILSEKVSGEYKVVVLSDIKGEKINGRFTFKR